MTTATFRTAARIAADRLDWAAAADNYQAAIDTYPTKGALAELDKARLSALRDGARGMIAA